MMIISPMHFNINSMFLWKKSIFYKSKKISEKKQNCVYIFTNLLNPLLINRWQIYSLICFCIQSVVINGFIWCIGRKASYGYVVRKRKSILITFLHNCGHSSLIFYPNWTSGSFFKVSCNVESEAVSIHFHTVTLKSTFLFWSLNGSVIHAWFYNIMHWSFWKYQFMTYAVLLNIHPFKNAISKNYIHLYHHQSH